MIPALLGTKVGMTRMIAEGGRAEPVTVVKCGPCVVLQVKTKESDGYDAVQLGFDDVKPHRSTKPMIGHAAKVGSGPKRVVREVRLSEPTDVSPGDVVTVDVFAESVPGLLDVVGVTKGKGYAGVMKRHGFGGKEASHGTERKHRSAGSIGGHAPGATGRGIKKGLRMAGQLGNVRRTQRAVELLKIDPEHDLMLIRGSVPGPTGGAVFVRSSKKTKTAKG